MYVRSILPAECDMDQPAVVARTCMVKHIARVWINRVRLPILRVVTWTGKIDISLSAFVPENSVSRDGFGVPSRVSLLIFIILRLNLVLTYYGINRVHLFILNRHTIRHRVSPEFIGSRNCVPMAFNAESPPAQGQ